MAREVSTLSLATCLPGFPGVVLIPLGRLPTSPIPLLARVALWFHHPHLRAGYIHARRISESIEAVAIARQPCGYAQRCGNNSSGIQERCRGSGGGSASSHTPTERVHGEVTKPSRQRAALAVRRSRQAATRVNAVQAPKQPDVEADPVAIRGRPPSWRQEGTTPHDATSSRVPPGYWRWHACTGRSDATREASAVGARGPRPTTREGQVGPFEVAERPVRARKPGNAGGVKGPQFKVNVTWGGEARTSIDETCWSGPTFAAVSTVRAGVDGQTFEDIETYSVGRWLDELAEDLRKRTFSTQRITGRVRPSNPGKTRRITLTPVFCSVATSTVTVFRGVLVDSEGESHLA